MSNVKKNFSNDQKKFEFTVYLNNNIIVQRFFNVIGFNKKAINSLNFKNVIDGNYEIIHKHMKNKTIYFMEDHSYEFYEDNKFEQNDSDDVMRMIVKMDGEIIAYREWAANIYPVKVRYTVDIRPYIYEMITRIQKCLSDKTENLELKYLSYDLVNHNA